MRSNYNSKLKFGKKIDERKVERPRVHVRYLKATYRGRVNHSKVSIHCSLVSEVKVVLQGRSKLNVWIAQPLNL